MIWKIAYKEILEHTVPGSASLKHLEAQTLKNLLFYANHGAFMGSKYVPNYPYITGLFSNMFIKSIQRCCPYAHNIQKLFVWEVNFIISLSSLISILIGKLHGDKSFNWMKSSSITQNNIYIVEYRQD